MVTLIATKLLNFNFAKIISGDFIEWWCPRTDSNRGPIDYKSIARADFYVGLQYLFIIPELKLIILAHSWHNTEKNMATIRKKAGKWQGLIRWS